MNRFGLWIAGAILASSPLRATSVFFDFTAATSTSSGGGTGAGSGYGNSMTYTSNGITMVVTTWSMSGNSKTTFESGRLFQWTGYGYGTCSRTDNGAAASTNDCGIPTHEINNGSSDKFIMFQFSVPVNITSITIDPYNTPDTSPNSPTTGGSPSDNPRSRNVSYYSGTSVANNLNLTGTSYTGLSALGFGSKKDVVNGLGANPANDQLTLAMGFNANTLLFGAQILAPGVYGSDYFKIENLTINTVTTVTGSQATPEPGSFVLLAAALVGLGFGHRRLQRDRVRRSHASRLRCLD